MKVPFPFIRLSISLSAYSQIILLTVERDNPHVFANKVSAGRMEPS